MGTHPSYSTAQRREYQRAYRAAGREKGYRPGNVTLPFIGVDGEGGNLDNGYHAYFLLRIGDAAIRPSPGHVRLTTRECLEFMCAQPRDAIYVVYFGDYDVTKILEDVPLEKLDRLIHPEKRLRKDGRGTFAVDWNGFQFDYLPRKQFKVRKQLGIKEYGPWFVLSDVGSFFQCRFVEALAKWGIGTAEEREAIGEGKEARASFSYADIDGIDRYNAMEIRLLQALMEKFRSACQDVGYIPKRWQGPGLLAEAMYAKHQVPRTRDVPLFTDPAYASLIEYARNAFYGGRPEVTVLGPITVPVFQWDINSAYPAAMLSVPCLIHGEWTYTEKVAELADALADEYAILHVKFTERKTHGRLRPRLFGLPVRSKDGAISYPGAGAGWYWAHEVRQAVHQSIHPVAGWRYRSCCDCQPLRFVSDVYLQRKSLGKDDAGIILKLGLNSLYGKTVQSIGSPIYANPIWGSYITAYCRAAIMGIVHGSEHCRVGACGADVAMIATDSICTWTDRRDLDESSDLGGLSREVHSRGMFLVQPGLYFGSSGKRAKTRGVPTSVIETMEDAFRSAYSLMVRSHDVRQGTVDVPQRMFVGIRLAVHRRSMKTLGQWVEFVDDETGRRGKAISFDWKSKRDPDVVIDPDGADRPYLSTIPPRGSVDVETVPYSKDIGHLISADWKRQVLEEQPDWTAQIEVGELA